MCHFIDTKVKYFNDNPLFQTYLTIILVMNYVAIRIAIDADKAFQSDILSELLGEIGFESFTFEEGIFTAYIPQSQFDREAVTQAISDFPIALPTQFTHEYIEGKNWNEEWEKNYFQPIIIADKCVIHSTFHKEIPQAEYDILIDPKMAFGTGHHETTSLILAELLEIELKGKSLLDMGCGTAVLAILAAMKGASPIKAIDIDEWAYQNALENIKLNQTTQIAVELGGAERLRKEEQFDIILANINRNILLQDMSHYVDSMHKGSILYMSGFYEDDIPVIREKAEALGLHFVHFKKKNKWVAVKFEL